MVKASASLAKVRGQLLSDACFGGVVTIFGLGLSGSDCCALALKSEETTKIRLQKTDSRAWVANRPIRMVKPPPQLHVPRLVGTLTANRGASENRYCGATPSRAPISCRGRKAKSLQDRSLRENSSTGAISRETVSFDSIGTLLQRHQARLATV